MLLEELKFLLQYFSLATFLHNNPPLDLAILAALIVFLLLLAKFICSFLNKKIGRIALNKTKEMHEHASPGQSSMSYMDRELFEKLMRATRFLLYVFIVFWGFRQLHFEPVSASLLSVLFMALCTWAVIRFFSCFIPFNLDLYLRKRGTTLHVSQARSLLPIVKGIIWAIGLTFLLDNIGFQVSTIIAGLGIAGVAAGLAGQAILSDFFSYIVILMDKPFKIGDFVVLSNGKSGEVVYLGPKNTRLLSLNNNIIVCANTEMTKGILENQGNVAKREVVLEVGVSFNVPIEKVRQTSGILKEVINSYPQCEFERAVMINFGTANYLFQLIYHVKPQPRGILDFMITQSEVNLALTERLNNAQLGGAYPTQSVLITQVSPQLQTITEPPASATPDKKPGKTE